MLQIILIFVFFIFTKPIFAENSILINEFLIDPQPQQIELINVGLNNIDISHWYIDDNGGTTYGTIPDNTVIFPNSCYIYSGDLNLNKSSADMIRLFDSSSPPTSTSAKLIDSYSYKSSPGTNISFQRIPDGQNIWIATSSSLGKFNTDHQSCIIVPSSTPSPIPTPTPTFLPTIQPTSMPTPTLEPITTDILIENVYISEVLPHPKSGEKEWVELFNNNNNDVLLNNWYIDDIENGGSLPKKISINLPLKSYMVIELPLPIFNDAGDQVRLLDQNKIYKDGFEYEKAEENISYGRIDFITMEICQQQPSKGLQNNPCVIKPTSTVTIYSQLLISSTPVQSQLSLNQSINQTKQKIIPTRTNPNFNTVQQAIDNRSNSDNNVLGVSTNYQPSIIQNNLVIFTAFLAFIYSILTIAYLSIKMKLSYEKNLRFYSSSIYSKRRK